MLENSHEFWTSNAKRTFFKPEKSSRCVDIIFLLFQAQKLFAYTRIFTRKMKKDPISTTLIKVGEESFHSLDEANQVNKISEKNAKWRMKKLSRKIRSGSKFYVPSLCCHLQYAVEKGGGIKNEKFRTENKKETQKRTKKISRKVGK